MPWAERLRHQWFPGISTPRFFTSQTGDVNKGFRATGGIWTLVIFNWKKALNFKRQFYASIRRQWTANWWQCGGCWLCAEFYANKNSNALRSYSHSVSDEQAAQFADILEAALKQGTYFNTENALSAAKRLPGRTGFVTFNSDFVDFDEIENNYGIL